MKYANWNMPPPPSPGVQVLVDEGLPPLVAAVLGAKGITTPAKAKCFLLAGRDLICEPFLLKDMDRAVERLSAALNNGEYIAVYGDYDADGITATALLTHYLRSRGARCTFYIPDRITQGCGLHVDAIRALKQQGVSLIVTVDCGSTCCNQVSFAKSLDMDVIVTDHHTCPESLPVDAAAVVNPKRPDCTSLFKHLAGVGVALKLAMAMTSPAERDPVLRRYAPLTAIGTIADVMRLTGQNRALVRLGLELACHSEFPGLAMLLQSVGLGKRTLSATNVGYVLAPRLNAAGRMGRASLAVDLLLTQNAKTARELSDTLFALNRERQTVESDIYTQATERIRTLAPEDKWALVLATEGWHQGVSGIVASRLSEQYNCPVFMISLCDGVGKGSCRCKEGFNLVEALEGAADLLDLYGGHPRAAGFTIREENLDAFRRRMNEYAQEKVGLPPPPLALQVDVDIPSISLLDIPQVEALALLEPYGTGNPAPVFALTGVTVSALSQVGNGRHLRLRVTREGQTLDAIFFSVTREEAGIELGSRVDLAFYPQINEFRGNRCIQLHLTDVRLSPAGERPEQLLFEKYRRGEALSPGEAAALIPTRDDFLAVCRFLMAHAGESSVNETIGRLTRRICREAGRHIESGRLLICLEVFQEQGFITQTLSPGRIQIALSPDAAKADLEDSAILLALKEVRAEGLPDPIAGALGSLAAYL